MCVTFQAIYMHTHAHTLIHTNYNRKPIVYLHVCAYVCVSMDMCANAHEIFNITLHDFNVLLLVKSDEEENEKRHLKFKIIA